MKLLSTLLLSAIVSTSAWAGGGKVFPPRVAGAKRAIPFANGTNSNQFQVDTIPNLAQFISENLFGSCVQVSNVQVGGGSPAIGHFSDSTGAMGFNNGLLMTTGSIAFAPGPNTNGASGQANALPGDPLLNTLIPGYSTNDASILEFDFIPFADTLLGFQYVFGSEEYPEFVGSNFNDVFGFFITPQGGTPINLATLPGSNTVVSINSVNQNDNSAFYNDNTNGQVLEYDAYLNPLQIFTPVTPNTVYHFKIAIADAGDYIFDSGVFLQAASFMGDEDSVMVDFQVNQLGPLSFEFQNLTNGANDYTWDFGDGQFSTAVSPLHQYSAPGTYNVSLLAKNYCYTQALNRQVLAGTTGLGASLAASWGVYEAEPGFLKISSEEQTPIQILSTSGQLVMSLQGGTRLFSTSGLASGIYLIQQGLHRTKFSVNRAN